MCGKRGQDSYTRAANLSTPHIMSGWLVTSVSECYNLVSISYGHLSNKCLNCTSKTITIWAWKNVHFLLYNFYNLLLVTHIGCYILLHMKCTECTFCQRFQHWMLTSTSHKIHGYVFPLRKPIHHGTAPNLLLLVTFGHVNLCIQW